MTSNKKQVHSQKEQWPVLPNNTKQIGEKPSMNTNKKQVHSKKEEWPALISNSPAQQCFSPSPRKNINSIIWRENTHSTNQAWSGGGFNLNQNTTQKSPYYSNTTPSGGKNTQQTKKQAWGDKVGSNIPTPHTQKSSQTKNNKKQTK